MNIEKLLDVKITAVRSSEESEVTYLSRNGRNLAVQGSVNIFNYFIMKLAKWN
jgi:hypothetical protein